MKTHIGEEAINNQGCLMKIIQYYNYHNIVVEFQDDKRYQVHTEYDLFKKGAIRNPYAPTVCKVGATGTKYPMYIDGKQTKEYRAWTCMLKRCYSEKTKENHPSYKEVVCCNDWLNFEIFYEWLHNQENFDKWFIDDNWAIDKDILVKNNKIYSPTTCCLVPKSINQLFVKRKRDRGGYPIGVRKSRELYFAYCSNPITNQRYYSKGFQTIEDAFEEYKTYKQNIIKEVAKNEFASGNIIKECYIAMMNYQVEITD